MNANGTANSTLASLGGSDTSSGLNSLSNRFALDVQGFDAMRAQANASPQAGLKAAAKQFDTVFTQMMLKSMREATPSDSPFDSHDTATFTSMLDQQMAQNMGSKGIGVADMMLKQLMRNAGAGTPSSLDPTGAGASGDSSANAGNIAAMNAMAKAYANTAASGASKDALQGKGYSANSALEPAARGVGTDKVAGFVDRLAAPAQAASAATGIPARFIIGQAALESGWGKREIKNADGSTSHNVFGIKATSDWTGKTTNAVTTEYVNGKPQKVVEKFRAYDSYEDALTDYASVLKSNPRYAPVVEASRDAAGFAHGMQKAGYATDPQYAKKLISIMKHIA
ncbi:flagellar assembly peptidoglycan hydrolase FlgJ [Caballeronia sordidicola]|jgi:flagellar protein FlgJ|uniref:Peptidoglycan hydrolase FlgJ n=1 Tax=Caballeronia sordidicola TaxID=196367 RepID=A0A242MML9_CABSO|nr:flagellar assembly peptidoglycan hydrolase FlgJ [Caballeronia sordidicola]MDP9155245.1 flagellar assembly peptidoglycan hydrolase FlgJ [Pseudomonadota bacterium]OTP72568.1 Flagellar protein FlgJ peptidoglycan hydrolase [Caballeronia sordidicola]